MQPSAVKAVFRDNIFDWVFGGGGVKGLSHAGSLLAAWERGIRIGDVYCVSIGSLVGTIFANGHPVPQLADTFMHELDRFGRQAFKNLFTVRAARNIFSNGGAVNVRPFFDDLVARHNLRPQPNLKIVAAYWNGGFKPHLFSGTEFDIATALHASCAMPPFIESVWVPEGKKNRRLIDGGVWHQAPHQFCTRPAIISRLGPARKLPPAPLHGVDMVIHLGEMVASRFKELFVAHPDPYGHFTIHAGQDNVATFTFNLSDKTCRSMVRHGYEQASRVLDQIERCYGG